MSRIKNKKAHKEFDERANYNITFDGYIPESVNWVEKNVVSPVDELFLCAAGWAFAAAGAIESRHAINTVLISSDFLHSNALTVPERWERIGTIVMVETLMIACSMAKSIH